MSRSSRRTSAKSKLPEDSRFLSRSTIAIVGGTGRMGRILAKLFADRSHCVTICSRDEAKAERVAAETHVRSGSIAEVGKANIVIVSVPIENTVEVCADVLKYMDDNSLLVEISSVKTDIVNRVLEFLPPRIEYLSLHPLFGPSARRLHGMNMIAIPVKGGRLSECMITSLGKIGFTVEISSVEEHDKMMAAFQVMHHYAYMTMAVELAKIARSSEKFSEFLTRSLMKTLGQIKSMSRIAGTILSIQRLNPYGLESRREYASSTQRMMSMDDCAFSEVQQAMKVLRDSLKAQKPRGTSRKAFKN